MCPPLSLGTRARPQHLCHQSQKQQPLSHLAYLPPHTAEAETKSLCKDRGPGESQDACGPQDLQKRQFLQLTAGIKAVVASYSFSLEADENMSSSGGGKQKEIGSQQGRAWQALRSVLGAYAVYATRTILCPSPQQIFYAALGPCSGDLRNPGSRALRGWQHPQLESEGLALRIVMKKTRPQLWV